MERWIGSADVSRGRFRLSTAWTETVRLLAGGSQAALDRISRLEIGEIVRVCERIIDQPYGHTCAVRKRRKA